jgi:hypothetical protein
MPLELTLFNGRKNIANTNQLTLQYFYEGDYCFMLNSSCSIWSAVVMIFDAAE